MTLLKVKLSNKKVTLKVRLEQIKLTENTVYVLLRKYAVMKLKKRPSKMAFHMIKYIQLLIPITMLFKITIAISRII